MKITRATLTALVLLAMLVLPVLAQEEEEVTVSFDLTVTGTPPEDATFFAVGLFDPRVADAQEEVQLVDPDGDGVYTDSFTTLAGEYDIAIVQGTGTQECDETFGGVCPGDPTRTIRDFGTLSITEDTTLSASVTFGGDDEQTDDQDDEQTDEQDDDEQETPEMPDTGAGGMAGGAGLPIGNIAAVLSLLAVSGYAILRRR